MNCVWITEETGKHYNFTLFTYQQFIYSVYAKPSMKLEPSDSFNIYFRWA